MNTETKVTKQDKVEKSLFWTMIVSVVTFVAALISTLWPIGAGCLAILKQGSKKRNSPYQSPPQTLNKSFKHNKN